VALVRCLGTCCRYVYFFWCYTATQVALQVQQERTQVVCSNKDALKRLTKSNSTPTMDLGLGTDHIRRYRGMCVRGRTDADTRTHTRTLTHTRIRTRVKTHGIRARTHAHAKNSHACTYARAHTHTRTQTHTCTHANNTHARTHTQTHSHAHARTHAEID